MFRMYFFAAAMICGFVLAGCEFKEPKRPVPRNLAGTSIDDGVSVQPATPVADQPAPAPTPEYKTTAQAGDSGFKRGQLGRTSIFNYQINSLFRTRERINLQLVEYNMKLYKAEHGNAPKTHEEFMSKIIDAGMIKLPELKEGCRYDYNPQTEELEIVHPLEMRP